jgi:hypothetical protein
MTPRRNCKPVSPPAQRSWLSLVAIACGGSRSNRMRSGRHLQAPSRLRDVGTSLTGPTGLFSTRPQIRKRGSEL